MPASQFPRSVSVPIAGSMRRGTPLPFFCKCSFHVTSSCALEYDKLREFHRKNIGALERRGGYRLSLEQLVGGILLHHAEWKSVATLFETTATGDSVGRGGL